MNDFIRLPKSKLAEIRVTLGESEGDDRETVMVCNLLTELAHQCEAKTNHRPVLTFDVQANDVLVGLIITGVPALSYTGLRSLVDMYPRDVCNVRFVFAHEVTGERMTSGVVHISFWRSAAPPERRQRAAYQPLRVNKRLRRCVELDYSNLNVDADDRATLDELVESLVVMARIMPELSWHVEPIVKRGTSNAVGDYAATHTTLSSVAPKKRSRTGWRVQRTHHRSSSASAVTPNGDVFEEDDTVQSDVDVVHINGNARSDSNGSGIAAFDERTHVGFCLFCRGVPNFDSAFLDYLKQKFGNRILDMFVLAPALWTDQQQPSNAPVVPSTLPPSSILTPGELAVSIRRAACTEADSGQYALTGVDRILRVLVRNAKAFGGVACEDSARK